MSDIMSPLTFWEDVEIALHKQIDNDNKINLIMILDDDDDADVAADDAADDVGTCEEVESFLTSLVMHLNICGRFVQYLMKNVGLCFHPSNE